MRPLPAGLPGANSPKWQSRRFWDSLGYLRVRSLSNPKWHRNVVWLTHVAVREQASQAEYTPDELPFYDAIIASCRRYPKTARGEWDAEASWDEVLAAIDELSLFRQARHVAAIHETWGENHGRGDARPDSV